MDLRKVKIYFHISDNIQNFLTFHIHSGCNAEEGCKYQYRKDFPLLAAISSGEPAANGRGWVYIDNAATSQRPQCVIDAEADFYQKYNAILTFTIEDVHPHDVSEILIADGICVRAGHHCAQPLLQHLGISSATRASFMFYNTEEEADRFVESIASVRERMGYGK